MKPDPARLPCSPGRGRRPSPRLAPCPRHRAAWPAAWRPPAHGEAAARQAIEEYRAQGDVDNELSAIAILVQSLLAQKKISDAQQVVAATKTSKNANQITRLDFSTADASVSCRVGRNGGSNKTAARYDSGSAEGRISWASIRRSLGLRGGRSEVREYGRGPDPTGISRA